MVRQVLDHAITVTEDRPVLLGYVRPSDSDRDLNVSSDVHLRSQLRDQLPNVIIMYVLPSTRSTEALPALAASLPITFTVIRRQLRLTEMTQIVFVRSFFTSPWG